MQNKPRKLVENSDERLRIAATPIPAGFPSPAEDYLEPPLNLFRHLVKNPVATYGMRVKGDSMQGAGIFDGDLVIIDRAADAEDGAIVVAVVEGEMTIKRLSRTKDGVFLRPENPAYEAIKVIDEEATVWGVVVYSIHRPK